MSSYKSIIFVLVRTAILFFSLYIKYKIVDSKTRKISTEEIIKDAEVLSHVPDHLKTENMRKHTVKKLPCVIKLFLKMLEI